MTSDTLGMFQGFGVELEYMIVDATSLEVKAIADRILLDDGGTPASEIEFGSVAWSNELALHVLELKTNGPASSLDGLEGLFQDHVRMANDRLRPHNAVLMPTAMHPWMDPARDLKIWPHEYGAVYHAFNRIFDCRGHGWANLQSAHINLPFGNDEEFARLHAAIRLVLPIVPALAASSPIADGVAMGHLDGRMEFYRNNAARVPSVMALVVPEPVDSIAGYERDILQRVYDDLAPLDPDGVLRHEWVNARGSIARFDRGAIEIRVIDVQECPAMDLVVTRLVVDAVRALASGNAGTIGEQNAVTTEDLHTILLSCITEADEALIDLRGYQELLGVPLEPMRAGDIWGHLFDAHGTPSDASRVELLVRQGCLARRIMASLAGDHSRDALVAVYRTLCGCLAAGEPFHV